MFLARVTFIMAVAAGCGSTARAPAAPAPVPKPEPSADGTEVVVGQRLSLTSKVLGEERTILVHRPPEDGSGAVYPVIYLLDGEGHFLHVAGLVQFLVTQSLMPPVIVVGLGNTDRDRDFTPTPDPTVPGSGGADRFLAFIEGELVPAIEQQFPAARYRVLIGHSLGGLLAVHALASKPDLFDAYISISPSLWWADDKVRPTIESLLASRPDLSKTLYFTIGTERDDMISRCRSLAELLRAKAPKGLRWQFEEMPKEDHGTIVHRAIYGGLEHVFAGWRPPENAATLEALEAHARALSERFGIKVRAPEQAVNLVGYRLLAERQFDPAIAVFRYNTENYPESANAYDSLAEAHEAKGQIAEALANYEIAVKKAAVNRDPRLEQFKVRLEQARARAPR